MDLSDKHELGAALGRLEATLEISLPDDIRTAYLDGRDADVVGYEKTVGSRRELSAIAKHALVAWSYLMQPMMHFYYDVFRAAQAVSLIRNLDIAMCRLQDGNVAHLTSVISRLRTATDLDDLDAVYFEAATAARYGQRVGFERVSFLPETPPLRSPDIRVDLPRTELFVECKRFDRMTDATATMAASATAAAKSILQKLRATRTCAVVEIVFAADPSSFDVAVFEEAVARSLSTGKSVAVSGARILVRRIRLVSLVDYALYPGPKYFKEHYGYARDQWHDIVSDVDARRAGPSWLDELDWEGAILWRVENDDLLWKMKRVGFARLFDGIRQLSTAGKDTVLHFWLDRDVGLGHRRDQLRKFVDALEDKNTFDFAWLIANETVCDVSEGGHFDFQEHASVIRGEQGMAFDPAVTTVFIEDDDYRGRGEWGIGVVLPSIDDEAKSSRR